MDRSEWISESPASFSIVGGCSEILIGALYGSAVNVPGSQITGTSGGAGIQTSANCGSKMITISGGTAVQTTRDARSVRDGGGHAIDDSYKSFDAIPCRSPPAVAIMRCSFG